jgi:WXG100 family type VII secretion target
MATVQFTIRFSYDEVKTIGSSFRNQEEEVKKTIGKLKNQTDKLREGDWIGEGATKFYSVMDGELLPALDRLQKAMAESGKVSDQLSQIFKDGEQGIEALWKSIPGIEISVS